MNATDSIRNLISLYAICLDTKSFPVLLSSVFTGEGASADFTSAGLGVIQGGEAIAATLAGFLKNVQTQHQLGTQRIMLKSDGKSADAVTYVQACHFGKGVQASKSWIAYAWYEDDLLWDGDLEKDDSDHNSKARGNGGWRIKTRKIGMHVSFPCFPNVDAMRSMSSDMLICAIECTNW
jgi:hypothetical protein